MTTLQPLNSSDLSWCVRRLPRVLFDRLRSPSFVGEPCFIAGGFIRSCIANEPVNDIDVFAPSEQSAYENALSLMSKEGGTVHTTANAHSVSVSGMMVQFIHRWTFTAPAECIQSFDFTIAQAALGFTDGKWWGLCHPDFYQDLAAKRLVYTRPQRNEDAGGSMLRVLKFYQRGYRIPLDSLGNVMARLLTGLAPHGQDFLRNPAAEEGKIGEALTRLLREVDPAVDPAHQAHLPSLASAGL